MEKYVPSILYMYHTYSSAHQSGDCFIILNPHIKEFNPVPMYSFKFTIRFFEMKQGKEKQ